MRTGKLSCHKLEILVSSFDIYLALSKEFFISDKVNEIDNINNSDCCWSPIQEAIYKGKISGLY